MLTAAFALAAFAAGVTGAWSPCGFSIVDTIASARRNATLALACAAFAVGALVGGLATFISLAALGALVPGSGARLTLPVAALALLAAVAEARGVRIVPQVRRQVPEPWRRRLPLPLATGAYGVLLGLGFATFVLTLAFWVLAAAVLVLADPGLGLVAGAAFAAGRALPVVVLAPLAGRPAGLAVVDAMAIRPRVLRSFRLANAVALCACAAALAAGGAAAGTVARGGASDPGVSGRALVWEEGGRGRLLVDRPATPPGAHHLGPLAAPLPGSDPAVGGELLAWREGSLVHVVRLDDLAPVAELRLPGVDALAVADGWLAYRTRSGNRDRIAGRALPDGRERVLATGRALGRPALAGRVVAFHVAARRESRIVAVSLAGGRARVVRRSRSAQLTNPSVHGSSLLYVRSTALAQTLVLGPLGAAARDRVLRRAGPVAVRDAGYELGHSPFTRTPRVRRASDHFWTTALSAEAAYLTLVPLARGAAGARIVRVPR